MAAIPLWAGSGVPSFEINQPMINQIVLAGSPNINLPANTTATVQLINPTAGLPNQFPYKAAIFELIVELTLTVPVGQLDNSTINFLLTGNTGRPLNLNFDTGGLLVDFSTLNVNSGSFDYQCSGTVRYGKNEPLILQISRVSGNPLIDMVISNIYTKIKVVD